MPTIAWGFGDANNSFLGFGKITASSEDLGMLTTQLLGI
jgi:hypothetical protein